MGILQWGEDSEAQGVALGGPGVRVRVLHQAEEGKDWGLCAGRPGRGVWTI